MPSVTIVVRESAWYTEDQTYYSILYEGFLFTVVVFCVFHCGLLETFGVVEQRRSPRVDLLSHA
jgi:hypothetical protein